jgi:hypothetical protein
MSGNEIETVEDAVEAMPIHAQIASNQNHIMKLEGWQKIILGLISMLTIVCSIGGGYMVTKAVTDYRLTYLERQLEVNKVKLDTLETFGHPDHERRLSKLEARVDSADKSIDDINRKLDVATAILQRIEVKVNSMDQARKP